MNMKTRDLILVLAIPAIVCGVASCSRFGSTKGQSTEFATFIKAYTGGVISDKSTIRIELTSNVPDVTVGADLKDGVLTFSPSPESPTPSLTPSSPGTEASCQQNVYFLP